MNVGTVCQREVVTIRHGATVLEAAQRMREAHVGTLVVLEEEDGPAAPLGIITDRDIVVEVLATAPEDLERFLVGDVMSRELATAKEDESLDAAVMTMRERGVRRLPVVDDTGTLVGILSLDDLFAAWAEQLGALHALVRREREVERDERS